ncbi:MAG: 3-oxoacyl-ACP synthase [Bacteroidota bacterium]
MSEPLYIQSYCRIRNGLVALNGESLFTGDTQRFGEFMKSLYKHLNLDHSKFFKMDNLSKLAFMGAEILLGEKTEKELALVFSNRAASLDTDRRHQASISPAGEGYASPAVFVYTLPNISMGEISIRYALHSENAFFVQEQFDPELLHTYSENLITTKKAKKVLCGWVDYDAGKYDAFLYIVANKGTFAHAIGEITRLYQTQ